MDDPRSSCEIFYPATRSWSKLKYFPQCSYMTCLIDGINRIFVLGGDSLKKDAHGCSIFYTSEVVAEYGWHTKRWKSLARLPMSLSNIQAVYSGGSLWVLAGVTVINAHLRGPVTAGLGCVFQYECTQNSWIVHSDVPGVRAPGYDVFPFTLLPRQ